MKVILVTHSPSPIALAPSESIYIMNKSGEHRLVKTTKQEALNILTEGFVSLTENTVDMSISYRVETSDSNVILFTEGITDKIILDTAWEKLYSKESKNFFIQDCFDAGFLCNFLKRNCVKNELFDNESGKIYLALFDFDKTGFNKSCIDENFEDESNDPYTCITKKHKKYNVFTMLLPVPQNDDIKNQVIKSATRYPVRTFGAESHLTIELLFYGIKEFKDNFNSVHASGGAIFVKFNGNKAKFAKKIKDYDSKYFENFVPLFDKIKLISDKYGKISNNTV